MLSRAQQTPGRADLSEDHLSLHKEGGTLAQGAGTVPSQPMEAVPVAGDGQQEVTIHLEKKRKWMRTPAFTPAEDVLRRAYLGWVIEQSEVLPLPLGDCKAADSREDQRLKLPEVYIPLRVLPVRSLLLIDRLRVAREEDSMSAWFAVDWSDNKFVLLGDPGSGKSTFLSFVALCVAGEALGRTDLNTGRLWENLPGEVEDWVESIMHPLSPGQRLPVRVVLRDFAAHRSSGDSRAPATAQRLWDFLQTQLDEAGHGSFFPILQRELLAGRGMVLLDGLDQLPQAEDRRQQGREAVADFVLGLGENWILATSRTDAYQDPASRLPGFEAVVALAPFCRERIRRFIELWYEHQVSLDRMSAEQAAEQGDRLRQEIFNSYRLRGLAESPLLLTLIASLHLLHCGDLPDGLEQLYEECVARLAEEDPSRWSDAARLAEGYPLRWRDVLAIRFRRTSRGGRQMPGEGG